MESMLTRRSLLKIIGTAAGTIGLSKLSFADGVNVFLNQQKKKKKKKKKEQVLREKTFFQRYKELEVVYENPLKSKNDVKDFIMEGKAEVSFENGRMRMQNILDASLGQKANFVYWCPDTFPDNIAITWDFYPIKEPGLSILFFSAMGNNGKDIFDKSLAKRSGDYKQYIRGDINAYHVSYFRRNPKVRYLQLSNLRKSSGFHFAAQGADPIPCVEFAKPPYNIRVVKTGPNVEFYIDELLIFDWVDDGKTYGPVLNKGKIGFRQMAPLIAEYSNFKVTKIKRIS